MTTTHRLDTLPAGTRFKYPECGKVATVLSHGLGGTRVKFENDSRTIEIEADEFTGRPARTFTVNGKPELVSSGSEVWLWPASESRATAPAQQPSAGGYATARRSKSSARSTPRRRTRRSARRWSSGV